MACIHVIFKRAKSRRPEPQATVAGLACVILFFLLAVTPCLHADTLDSSIIGMFPKDVSEIGYADLQQARQFPWFPQFEAQLVPVSLFGFEQFLETAQMRQTPSIDIVAWARVAPAPGSNPQRSTGEGGQIVAVALGQFDTGTIQSFLDSRKVPSVQVGSYTLYASETGVGTSDIFFTLVDGRTIAFGPLEPLKRVLGIREGEEESLLENEKMMALIDQANGDGVFWGVLGSGQAGRAIDKLVPEATTFPQSRDLIGKMHELLIIVRAPSDIEIDFQATSESSNDAMLLSQLLQVGVLYRRYESGKSNPELAAILDGLRVSANGDRLELSLSLTDDQVLSLIEHNTFSLSM